MLQHTLIVITMIKHTQQFAEHGPKSHVCVCVRITLVAYLKIQNSTFGNSDPEGLEDVQEVHF